MKRNLFYWLDIVLVFILGLTVASIYFISIWSPAGQPEVFSDSTMIPGAAFTSTPMVLYDFNVKNEVQEIKHRLNALDGGKKKLWSCPYWIKKNVFSWDGHPIGIDVVQTIGAETPKQLDYTGCTLIPESQWDVTKTPINQ